MSDIPEWTTASDGSWLHRTTIQYRVDTLGWDMARASSEPVRERSPDEERSIAARAREDKITPGKIQVVMRTYGVDYEQARQEVLRNDPDEGK